MLQAFFVNIFKYLGKDYDAIKKISGGKDAAAVYADFLKNSPLMR